MTAWEKFGRKISYTLVALLSAASVSAANESGSVSVAESVEKLNFVPLQAIVKFTQGALPPRDSDLRIDHNFGSNVFLISLILERGQNKGFDAVSETRSLIKQLTRRGDVEYAHPNYLLAFSQNSPNDPLFPMQWSLTSIRAPEAWEVTTGDPAVKIAILDGGRSSHPELVGKWLAAYNAANPGGALEEYTLWAHATHVASIASGSTDNSTGIAGVCPDCQLMSVKIIDTNGLGTIGYAMAGIDWAVENGANLINISSAWEEPCINAQGLQDVIEDARQNNVSIIVSAGNFGGQLSNVIPASCAGVIAVGATDQNDVLASYSSRGAGISIMAPGGGGTLGNPPQFGDTAFGSGVGCPPDPASEFGPYQYGVLAAWKTTPAGGGTHCYRYLSGTSMAAPHVSGVVGLMLSVNPELDPIAISEILAATAQPVAGCGSNCGAGLIDAEGAVEAALDPGLLNINYIEPIISYILD